MDDKPSCPHCERTDRQHRSGKGTGFDVWRYRCMYCNRKYTYDGIPRDWRYQYRFGEVLDMLHKGMTIGEIAKKMEVTRQTVHNWLKRHAEEIKQTKR